MDLLRLHAKDLAGLMRDSGKQLRGIVRVEPIQRPSQTINALAYRQ
jgi:hypothetical protein